MWMEGVVIVKSDRGLMERWRTEEGALEGAAGQFGRALVEKCRTWYFLARHG